MTKNVYLYVLDTLSDWEIAYITTHLNSPQYFKKNAPVIKLIIVSDSAKPVTTMGGMKIRSDVSVEQLQVLSSEKSENQDDMLILPGGNTWFSPERKAILDVAALWITSGKTVAAICGATMALASAGLLNNIKHTSNDKEFLKQMCPAYNGENLYQTVPVVSDKNVITASGTAPVQ